jgi:16S rRNA C967 or C1407 C5-methylase (RsmB/RsmF family)/NOL1/NOP2/fmu family ribosome biogenesis protein
MDAVMQKISKYVHTVPFCKPTFTGIYRQMQLPELFVTRMRQLLGEESDQFYDALKKPAPVSIRLNPFKPTALFDDEKNVPWTKFGKYLNSRISFTLDPLVHAGCDDVQEASSMYLEQTLPNELNRRGSSNILDLCAAPGGKSTHILSLIPKNSLLVSNEIVPSRNRVLVENINKWGCSNVIITQNKPEDFGRIKGFFDIVIVDAPCSGEGLFRKDPDAVNEWKEHTVAACAARQKQILESSLDCLKSGGLLIYSTCTYSEEENDKACEFLVRSNQYTPEEIPCTDGAVKTRYGIQLYPHHVAGEGFFMAALRKNGVGTTTNKNAFKVKSKNPEPAGRYLDRPEEFKFFKKGDLQYAIPVEHFSDFDILQKQLYIRKAGVCMGTIKNDVFIPSHELALFNGLNQDINNKSLTTEEALSYLRLEAPGTEVKHQGWHLAVYGKYPLGWLKGIGKRVNNYFPKELRILKRQ